MQTAVCTRVPPLWLVRLSSVSKCASGGTHPVRSLPHPLFPSLPSPPLSSVYTTVLVLVAVSATVVHPSLCVGSDLCSEDARPAGCYIRPAEKSDREVLLDGFNGFNDFSPSTSQHTRMGHPYWFSAARVSTRRDGVPLLNPVTQVGIFRPQRAGRGVYRVDALDPRRRRNDPRMGNSNTNSARYANNSRIYREWA